MPLDLELLTLEQCQPLVGDPFALSAHTPEGEPRELELVLEAAAAGPGAAPADGVRRPFSLVFRGPLDAPLPQGITPLRHVELGEVGIFLVPIGSDGEGRRYEAVFA